MGSITIPRRGFQMPIVGFLVVLLFVGFEVSRLAPNAINPIWIAVGLYFIPTIIFSRAPRSAPLPPALAAYHQVYREECRKDESGDDHRPRKEFNESRAETTVRLARRPHLKPPISGSE
jgi:hypothetical protein